MRNRTDRVTTNTLRVLWWSAVAALASQGVTAWISPSFIIPQSNRQSTTTTVLHSSSATSGGSLHGQDSCFMPLKQLDQDYFAPRIVQIAGAYPGLTKEDFMAVTSEPAPEPGQWTYDFSDPDGSQLGTVALEGSALVHDCQDPVAIIAEHFSLGIDLPKEIVDPVDLVVLVDRSKQFFGERVFLVVDVPGQGVTIAAYHTKADLPPGGEILGQVILVQIPWLPCMAPTKTGFMEEDEYF